MATLDDALSLAVQLLHELTTINIAALATEQRPLVADALDMTATARSRIESAIAIDDQLHPEAR